MSQHTLSVAILAVLGVAATIAGTPPASAADLDLDAGYANIPPVAEQKVEFGTGWYIRGDMGVSRLPSIQNSTPPLPTANDPTVPNAPTTTVSQSSRVGYVASIGAGYQVNNWLRTDVIADFHQPIANSSVSGNGNVFCPTGVSYPNKTTDAQGNTNYGAPQYADGSCTGTYKSNLKSFDVLINAYYDLGTWHKITPYVGAGAGVSFGHYQTSATYVQSNNEPYHITYTDPQYNQTFAPNYDRSSSGQYYSFAWALMAGFSFDVFDHTKLDIGYRYLNLGAIPGVSGTLTTQEVRAGLRYMVDN